MFEFEFWYSGEPLRCCSFMTASLFFIHMQLLTLHIAGSLRSEVFMAAQCFILDH